MLQRFPAPPVVRALTEVRCWGEGPGAVIVHSIPTSEAEAAESI